MVARAGVALVCILGTGCSLVTDSFVTNEFSGDPFPTQVETQSGAVIVGLRQSGFGDRVAVLDVLSPVTLVDPGPTAAPSVSSADLLMLGARGAGGPLDLTRANLASTQVISLHPCSTDECVVGPESAPRPYDAILGADALAGDALRLRLGDDQLFLLADIGGDEVARTRACDGVFPSPYRGGGTLLIGGTELSFGGRRVTLQSCLGFDPDPALPQSLRGADALLVMSTGVGVTILGKSVYQRYVEAHPTAPSFDALPEATVFLASGPTTGRAGVVDGIALVASSSSTPRAPCRQDYGSHFMVTRACVPGDDCPCENGATICSMPAVVELATAIDVLVVEDDNATLQALRTELRPDQPEVDGILGTNAIRTLEVDLDYPHDRVLARCSTDGCTTRPALAAKSDLTQVRGCLGDMAIDPNFTCPDGRPPDPVLGCPPLPLLFQ
jgi:hypothetical protein